MDRADGSPCRRIGFRKRTASRIRLRSAVQFKCRFRIGACEWYDNHLRAARFDVGAQGALRFRIRLDRHHAPAWPHDAFGLERANSDMRSYIDEYRSRAQMLA